MGRQSDTREIIINTARSLFLTNSYAAISVDKICKAANINKGSFYHFFSSKQELLLEVIDRNWEFLMEMMELKRTDFEDKPLKRIDKMFENLYIGSCSAKENYGNVPGCPVGSFGNELSGQDEVIREKVTEVFANWASFFEKTVSEAQAKGNIEKSLNPKDLGESLLSFVQGLLLVAKTKNDPEYIKEHSQNYLKLIK